MRELLFLSINAKRKRGYLISDTEFKTFRKNLGLLIKNILKKCPYLTEEQLLKEMGFPKNLANIIFISGISKTAPNALIFVIATISGVVHVANIQSHNAN